MVLNAYFQVRLHLLSLAILVLFPDIRPVMCQLTVPFQGSLALGCLHRISPSTKKWHQKLLISSKDDYRQHRLRHSSQGMNGGATTANNGFQKKMPVAEKKANKGVVMIKFRSNQERQL